MKTGGALPVRVGMLLILMLGIGGVSADRIPTAAAQSPIRPSAFDHLQIGLNSSFSLSHPGLDDYWQTGSGFNLTLSTPFYAGELEASVGISPLNSRLPDIPDLQTIGTFLGWRYPVNLASRGSAAGGFFFGNQLMYRPAEGILEGPESEFSAGVEGLIRFDLSDAVVLRGRVRRSSLYTYHRIHQTALELGIEYRFRTPAGIKRFLQ